MERLQNTFANTDFHPITEPFEHRVPFAENQWKITPGATGAGDPQNGLRNKRETHPVRPGSVRLPKQWGFRNHIRSVMT